MGRSKATNNVVVINLASNKCKAIKAMQGKHWFLLQGYPSIPASCMSSINTQICVLSLVFMNATTQVCTIQTSDDPAQVEQANFAKPYMYN